MRAALPGSREVICEGRGGVSGQSATSGRSGRSERTRSISGTTSEPSSSAHCAMVRRGCLETMLFLVVVTAAIPGAFSEEKPFGVSFRTETISESSGEQSERRFHSEGRDPKYISFSTDNSQIGVELGFTVPLLKVPLQGAAGPHGEMNGFGSKKPIDVNIGALAVAGSMLLTVMGIIPSLYHVIAKPKPSPHSYSRASDESGSWVGEAGRLLGAAEAALTRRGVDPWSCGGQALCGALAGAAARVRRGRAGSLDLVLHGLARSRWVSSWVAGTGLASAALGEDDAGRCEDRFSSCQMPLDLARLFAGSNSAESSPSSSEHANPNGPNTV